VGRQTQKAPSSDDRCPRRATEGPPADRLCPSMASLSGNGRPSGIASGFEGSMQAAAHRVAETLSSLSSWSRQELRAPSIGSRAIDPPCRTGNQSSSLVRRRWDGMACWLACLLAWSLSAVVVLSLQGRGGACRASIIHSLRFRSPRNLYSVELGGSQGGKVLAGPRLSGAIGLQHTRRSFSLGRSFPFAWVLSLSSLRLLVGWLLPFLRSCTLHTLRTLLLLLRLLLLQGRAHAAAGEKMVSGDWADIVGRGRFFFFFLPARAEEK
jgi:hypothetical protein